MILTVKNANLCQPNQVEKNKEENFVSQSDFLPYFFYKLIGTELVYDDKRWEV